MTTKQSIAALLFAVAASFAGAPNAHAGRGGSNEIITAAVQSGSVDSIIASVEQAEGLMCTECVATVQSLTADSRYRVREVAGWWFARRPQLAASLSQGFVTDLASGDSVRVRNAADFLGAVRNYGSLPALQAAMTHGGVKSEAKLAIVRAVGFMAHVKGNATLLAAMADNDPTVRAAAVSAWRDVLGQTSVEGVMPLLGDADAEVRAKTATLAGAYAAASARPVLEQLVTSDTDATVRRNAAWALSKIGDPASRQALTIASSDQSGLVRGVAKAALASLAQRK